MSYRVPGDKTPCSAQDILEGLSCGRQGCPCQRALEKGYGNTHCPSHDDHHPSLTVKQSTDGRALVNCKFGCDQKLVLDALDTLGFWLNPPKEKPLTAVAAPTRKWGYVNEAGELLAYHCRKDTSDRKIMWWQRPDGTTSNGDIHDVDLPLYGLPNLLAHPDVTVLLCEGEKAVDAAEKRGFLAVSFCGGASQKDFGPALNALTGRDVVLWPDADSAGLGLMQLLYRQLQPIVWRLRWLLVPGVKEKDDAVDYFAHGGTTESLQELIKESQAYRPHIAGLPRIWSWQELQRTYFAPPSWLIPNMLPTVGLTILGGKPKVGKSWLALQIAGAIGSGDEIFGVKAESGNVLYFCIEDRAPRVKDRSRKQQMDPDARVSFVESLESLDQGGLSLLGELTDVVQPNLIVIDTLASAKSGEIDENAAGPMADLSNALQNFAHTRNLAMLLVAHQRKGDAINPIEALRGSSAIGAAADMVWGLTKRPLAMAIFSIVGRDTEDAEYRLEFDEFRWKYRGNEQDLAKRDAEDLILETLSQLGEVDAGAVARETGKTRQGIIYTLGKLTSNGQVTWRSARFPGDRGSARKLYRITGTTVGDAVDTE